MSSTRERKRHVPRGRKKIAMKKIEDRDKLDICFSKRRQGFFNMCADVSILCGADIAAIAFSPFGRAYCFGSPSVDRVVGRFLGPNHAPLESDAKVLDQLKLLVELQGQIDKARAKMELELVAIKWMEEEEEEEETCYIDETALLPKVEELRELISDSPSPCLSSDFSLPVMMGMEDLDMSILNHDIDIFL